MARKSDPKQIHAAGVGHRRHRMEQFREIGVELVRWSHVNDAEVCPACRALADRGPMPRDEAARFIDGSHCTGGACRCGILAEIVLDDEEPKKATGKSGCALVVVLLLGAAALAWSW